MILTYRHLEQIQALAAFKSFARASRHLHLSQPALSRSIATLEAQLEVKLFDRHHNNISPTLFGKYILEKGVLLLQEMKLLHRDLRLLRDNQAGEIHIGSGPFPAEMFIGDALAEFHSTYPKLNIHVTVDMTPKLLRSLRERMLDLFVSDTRMIMQETDLEMVSLKQRQAYFCCRKDHPLTVMKGIGVEEVFEYPLATMWLPESVVAMLRKISGANLSEITDLPHGVIKCDNFGILLRIISATNAIGISCEEVISKSCYGGDIIFLPIRLPEFMTHYGIVSLKGCTRPPAMAFLNQCIVSSAGG
jgi:DNA-binding transcriptional LysR family regulator